MQIDRRSDEVVCWQDIQELTYATAKRSVKMKKVSKDIDVVQPSTERVAYRHLERVL
jgi:hypothetical protein